MVFVVGKLHWPITRRESLEWERLDESFPCWLTAANEELLRPVAVSALITGEAGRLVSDIP